MSITALFAGLISGILASMGLGGGAVLLLYLVFFLNYPQVKAGGINLLFFIPIAIVSISIYAYKKQIRFKDIVFIVSGGVLGCVSGVFLTSFFTNSFLSKAFGIFLCVLGAKEILNTVKLYLKK
ncbi:MAG: sulfite exporter TauE/SafE family protein [Clostridia bacterium]|nr:sulfite exporter TauE/SafE family protein [Clostridia bacterium]